MKSNPSKAESFLNTRNPGIAELEAAIAEPAPDYDGWINEEAAKLKKDIWGEKVTFVVNRNINFTNVCRIKCLFCGYSVPPGHAGAFVLGIDEILEKITESMPVGITEVCITGGLNPSLNLAYLTDMVRAISCNFPRLHIHAFSPMEISWLARREGLGIKDVLENLKTAGLGSMPGTAAEILVDSVRKKICPGKIVTADWVEVIKSAHSMGIPTTATIMFGHIETALDIAKHLSILKQIQEETGGFTEFVPLPFIPFNTALKDGNAASLNKKHVKRIHAVARIFFRDLIPNIQVSWTKLGVETARELLHSGVSDFGGTLIEENITRMAGGSFGQYLPREQIVSLIREEGFIPAERDTIYSRIKPA